MAEEIRCDRTSLSSQQEAAGQGFSPRPWQRVLALSNWTSEEKFVPPVRAGVFLGGGAEVAIHIKVLTLGFDRYKEGFDSCLLDDFLKNVQLISSSEHFFSEGSKHYISFVLKYELSESKLVSTKKSEWKQALTEESAGVFALLRDWRFQKAKSEGVPPYVVFSNNQLCAIANTRPQSLTDLARIDGVGEAKIKKYGEQILQLTSHDPAKH